MPISKEQIARVAELARLKLTSHELDQFSRELSRIIDYIDCLNRVDVDDIDLDARPITPGRAGRDDVVGPSLPVADVLRIAPETKDTYFVVPRVI
jgi:aspartyl-tRNA(Asn)/glutamyl-tRNA(Gln) amidotransferase subunit C